MTKPMLHLKSKGVIEFSNQIIILTNTLFNPYISVTLKLVCDVCGVIDCYWLKTNSCWHMQNKLQTPKHYDKDK